MEKLIATDSVTINAPAEKVWEAITDPELIKQYFFGTQVETDWQVGKPIVFRGVWQDKAYEDKGTILKYEAKHELQFSYWSNLSGTEDKPENYSTITYTLLEQDGSTKLTVTQDNVKSEEAKQHSEANWNTVLMGLKKLVEQN